MVEVRLGDPAASPHILRLGRHVVGVRPMRARLILEVLDPYLAALLSYALPAYRPAPGVHPLEALEGWVSRMGIEAEWVKGGPPPWNE